MNDYDKIDERSNLNYNVDRCHLFKLIRYLKNRKRF